MVDPNRQIQEGDRVHAFIYSPIEPVHSAYKKHEANPWVRPPGKTIKLRCFPDHELTVTGVEGDRAFIHSVTWDEFVGTIEVAIEALELV